jgi:hypothetical protein
MQRSLFYSSAWINNLRNIEWLKLSPWNPLLETVPRLKRSTRNL